MKKLARQSRRFLKFEMFITKREMSKKNPKHSHRNNKQEEEEERKAKEKIVNKCVTVEKMKFGR